MHAIIISHHAKHYMHITLTCDSDRCAGIDLMVFHNPWDGHVACTSENTCLGGPDGVDGEGAGEGGGGGTAGSTDGIASA